MALDDLWDPHASLGADGSLDDFRLSAEVGNGGYFGPDPRDYAPHPGFAHWPAPSYLLYEWSLPPAHTPAGGWEPEPPVFEPEPPAYEDGLLTDELFDRILEDALGILPERKDPFTD